MKMTPLYVISIFFFYQSLQAALAVQEIPQYFGKTLNTEELSGSFPLSGRELGKYIQNRGVEVISLTPGETPEVPQADINEWRESLRKKDALGRYLTPEAALRYVDRPTIVVLSLNDKWTTIHEYMHFLYDQKRAEQKALTESQVFEAQKNTRADYLELSAALRGLRSLDFDLVRRSVVAFSEYMKFELQLLRQTAAEEIAIENTLSRLYEQNQIPDLHLKQYQTAQNYISDNQERLQNLLRSFLDIHQDLTAVSGGLNGEALISTRQDLDQFSKQLDATLTR